jgi:uncharacterized membrane protein YbaN (DUF454 family)
MKTFLNILGFIFLALAVIGAILPVMPTTCFVLGAAACFAKSSPRFHRWLLDSRLFGPIITNWQATRSMPRRAKIIAITSVICSGAISVTMLDSAALQLTVVGLLLIPVVIILRIRTSEELVPVAETD